MTPSRASNHGGVANLGNHPVEPRDRARPLDPAFDPNSDYYTSSRAQYQAQRQKARGGKHTI